MPAPQPQSVQVVNAAGHPIPVTYKQEPHTLFYTQDQELGATFTQSFQLPPNKKFIVRSLNSSLQTPYKGSYLKLVVTTNTATFKYTYECITDTNFPYGLYRICHPVFIIAEGNVNVEVSLVTASVPDEEIGDLLIALTGYLVG